MLQHCFAVYLQKCLVDYETSHFVEWTVHLKYVDICLPCLPISFEKSKKRLAKNFLRDAICNDYYYWHLWGHCLPDQQLIPTASLRSSVILCGIFDKSYQWIPLHPHLHLKSKVLIALVDLMQRWHFALEETFLFAFCLSGHYRIETSRPIKSMIGLIIRIVF